MSAKSKNQFNFQPLYPTVQVRAADRTDNSPLVLLSQVGIALRRRPVRAQILCSASLSRKKIHRILPDTAIGVCAAEGVEAK